MGMEYKPLPIGTEDFKEIIETGFYYVDKTLLLRDLLDNLSKVTLFTRPRRFGKTLNMSMLKYFFEDTGEEALNAEYRTLFDGLKIMDAGEKYTSQMQQYPVISLTLKSAKQADFSTAYDMLVKGIAREFRRHEFVLDSDQLSAAEKDLFLQIRDWKAKASHYADALQFLSDCLYKVTGKKSIILIDEYDVPLENSYFQGFYDKMISFIRSLFESALKTNPNLQFAVITGCLRISKESIFTGLNNLEIVSILNETYGEHFGFTPKEVEAMAAYYGVEERMDDIRRWYDGYLFGISEVYNPWSVVNFMKALRANKNAFGRPYWANTSSNEIVRDLIRKADNTARAELEILMAGGTIRKPIHEDITYEDIQSNQDNLWNFLFFTGYLKKVSEEFEKRKRYLTLTIPNDEVLSIYEDKIQEWFEEAIQTRDLSALYRALFDGDAQAFQEQLAELLRSSVSYMDSAEAFYHGFLMGVFQNLGGSYLIKSNQEAGNGRYDICIYNLDAVSPAAVIELKKAEKVRQMEQAAEKALKQIVAFGYDAPLAEEGYEECWHVGIGFFRKQCRVKMEKAKIDAESAR